MPALMNHKITLVANPFRKPLEEIVSKLSLIPFIKRTHNFLHGITADGISIQPTEYLNGKLNRRYPKIRTPDLYYLPGQEPFKHGFTIDSSTMHYPTDFSISPNGWLVFDSSRTKIREILFQIYKMFSDIKSFPKIHWIEENTDLRIGFSEDEQFDIIPNPLPNIPSKRVINGGGGMGNSVVLIPVPPRNSTMHTIKTIMEWSDTKSIIGLITRNNYAYTFDESGIIQPWIGPNISFMDLKYDCIAITKEFNIASEQTTKTITVTSSPFQKVISWGPDYDPYQRSFKKRAPKFHETIKEFIGNNLSKDAFKYDELYSDEEAMYFTRNYTFFIDTNFVSSID